MSQVCCRLVLAKGGTGSAAADTWGPWGSVTAMRCCLATTTRSLRNSTFSSASCRIILPLEPMLVTVRGCCCTIFVAAPGPAYARAGEIQADLITIWIG